MTGPVLQSAAHDHDHLHNQQLAHTDTQLVRCAASAAATPVPASGSTMSAWLRKLRLHGDTHRQRAASISSTAASAASSTAMATCEVHKTLKQPSFLKTLFHPPHELTAVGHASARAAPDAATATESQRQHHHRRHARPESSDRNGDAQVHQQHRKQGRHHTQLQQQQQQQQQQEQHQHERVTPPVQIPSTYMGRDFHGAVAVGGRRVPFTLEAHRRPGKKSSRAALASIAETHVVSSFGSGANGSASMQAYRSRAYYQPPGSKAPRKDKR